MSRIMTEAGLKERIATQWTSAAKAGVPCLLLAPLTAPWALRVLLEESPLGLVSTRLSAWPLLRWAEPVIDRLPSWAGLLAGLVTFALGTWAVLSAQGAVRDGERLRDLRRRAEDDGVIADMHSRR